MLKKLISAICFTLLLSPLTSSAYAMDEDQGFSFLQQMHTFKFICEGEQDSNFIQGGRLGFDFIFIYRIKDAWTLEGYSVTSIRFDGVTYKKTQVHKGWGTFENGRPGIVFRESDITEADRLPEGIKWYPVIGYFTFTNTSVIHPTLKGRLQDTAGLGEMVSVTCEGEPLR